MPDHSENRKLTSLFQRKFSESYTILESQMYQREYSADVLLIAFACSGKSVHCRNESLRVRSKPQTDDVFTPEAAIDSCTLASE